MSVRVCVCVCACVCVCVCVHDISYLELADLACIKPKNTFTKMFEDEQQK